jgi:hypothetical protein
MSKYDKNYYQEHKKTLLDNMREYYCKHKSKRRKTQIKYYWANREKILAKGKADRALLKQLKKECNID